MSRKDFAISKEVKEGAFIPLEEKLSLKKKNQSLLIGIPKETTFQENRVALVPSSVATLSAHGHRVILEAGAGERSNFSDKDYAEAGAEIAYDGKKVFQANIVIKVAPPTEKELEYFQPNQIFISPIHLPNIEEDFISKLCDKKVIALAMEYIQDDNGTFPIVRILSEMAGISAMLTAGELLTNTSGGNGVLLGGISGVPSAKVVILGGGVVAEYATRTALGLGAEVKIFDDNIYKLMRIQHLVGQQLYTSALNPAYLMPELFTADVVIGAIHAANGRTPVVVSEEMVAQMKPGSVIVDVSIDQGGCFATSRMTSHDNPTFKEFDVIHYCVPNIASRVSRTASVALSNTLTPILLKTGKSGSLEQLLEANKGLRHGVYTYKGCLTNDYLGDRFQIKATNLDLLLASRF